jgi:CO/xanthine dehydrogenase FAD-binding subunit
MRRFDMYVPGDIHDLLEYLTTHQTGVHLIANGSDLINRIQRRQINPKILVDLSGLTELNYVRKDGNTIRVGALTTIADIATSPVIDSRLEAFREVASKFGGPAITNVATIGGNICAASSSEDLLPLLLVLDARVLLKSKRGERIMPLEDFLRDKRVTDLRPYEILAEVMFEQLGENSACAFEKIGMRNSLTIALVSVATYITLSEKTDWIEDARIAYNRVTGKIPERAKLSEEKLRGNKLSKAHIDDCVASLRNELRLRSDFRVSGEYRLDTACALFRRAMSRCVERITGEVSFV